MYKVMVTDYQWDSLEIERRILREANAELLVAESGTEEELLSLAPQADAILSCWKYVSAQVIDAAPRCRIITRYGVGLDNIDVKHATTLGIPVSNSPTYCSEEVAEHALGLALALARRLTRFDREIRKGSYPGTPFKGIRRIQGRTLGLVGYGNIGRMLAWRARGIGLKVIAYDPQLQSLPAEEGRLLPLSDLLAQADFISLHVPLNEHTQGLAGRDFLAQMKRDAFLINTCRGGVVDLEALYAALAEERIAGAALDVFPQEPPELGHPIFQLPQFIATPHSSFYSEESVEILQHMSAGQVRKALMGEEVDHIVNPQYREHTPRWPQR